DDPCSSHTRNKRSSTPHTRPLAGLSALAPNGLIQTVDFPLIIVGTSVLLILVVDGMLFVAPVNFWSEAAADRILFFRNFFIWPIESGGVCGGSRRRRSSGNSGGVFVSRSGAWRRRRGPLAMVRLPRMCREPTPAQLRGS